MSEYQFEEELLSAFVKERMRSGPAGEETAIRAADEYMAWKKGMIAEVERAAAEKAWDEGHAAGEQNAGDGFAALLTGVDGFEPRVNPYRREETE